MNALIEAVLAKWQAENPLAYRWVEAIASLETADHVLTTNNIHDISALDVQDALFPLDVSDSQITPLTIQRPTHQTVQVTPPVVIALPKTWRKTETLQHHPLMSVKVPSTTPKGWRVSITRAAARQIAAYCLGRPTYEWSAVATVDTHWSAENTASYVIRELFFCDAGQDAGAHSRIPAEWEMKLIDRLLKENRDEDIPKLFGHVHSHNSMGAFWSQQDVLMCGQRLDDMSAASNRLNGVAVSVVVDNNLKARARMDWFVRGEANTPLRYGTFDPLPLTLAPPRFIAVQDVQNARESVGYAQYNNSWLISSSTNIWDDNDLEEESWYDYKRTMKIQP